MKKSSILWGVGLLAVPLLFPKRKTISSILPPSNMIVQNESLVARLKNFLSEHEGYKKEAYRDIAGHWTIGIGHKLLPHEMGLRNGTITDYKVMQLFHNDISKPLLSIRNNLKGIPLTLNQTVAACSFIFNMGVGAWESSTLLKKWKAGADLKEVAEEFKRWVYYTDPVTGEKKVSKGLASRRDAEYNLFLSS